MAKKILIIIPLILSIGIISGISFVDAIDEKDAETECREGQILVFRINANNYVCVSEATAERWVELGIAEIVVQETMEETMEEEDMKETIEEEFMKHHGWTSFTATSDSRPHPQMMGKDETHNMIMVLPLSDKVYKGIVSYDVTEPVQLISIHGPIPDDEKGGQLVWTHPDTNENIALTVEFPENSMGSWLFTGNAMAIHTLREETFTATYSVSYKELELSDTVKSGTMQSMQDPGIGHENHQLAIILPPNEKIYSGVLSFTASEPVQLVTLHGPLAEGEDRGQAIWTTDGVTKYGLTFYEPETKDGTWRICRCCILHGNLGIFRKCTCNTYYE